MLFAGGLIIVLLLGFVLGRLWEIRKRILLAGPVDERSRPVEVRVATKLSKQAPRSGEERLAALDREMQDLIKAVAIHGPDPNNAVGNTGHVSGPSPSPIVLDRIWPRATAKPGVDQTVQTYQNGQLR